jgi:hypothetical protein
MKYVNNNDHVVNFSVAVNERWKNRNGDPQERTTWLRIVAFNGLGSACAEFLKRGDPVFVEGRLQIREYEDKDHIARTFANAPSADELIGRDRITSGCGDGLMNWLAALARLDTVRFVPAIGGIHGWSSGGPLEAADLNQIARTSGDQATSPDPRS